jgi:hypothetical protein
VVLYLARFPYNLARNYIAARKLGLPIIIVPIDQHHLIWMLISVPLRPVFKVRDDDSAHTVDCFRSWEHDWKGNTDTINRDICQKASMKG